MPVHAAAATTSLTDATSTYATVVIFLVIACLGYLGWCWLSPFGRCRACATTGRTRIWLSRRRRSCSWCKGTGIRLRLGRRFINHVINSHRDSR